MRFAREHEAAFGRPSFMRLLAPRSSAQLALLTLVCVVGCARGRSDDAAAAAPSQGGGPLIPPAAVDPDLGRAPLSAPRTARVVVTVDGTEYAFSKACAGAGVGSGTEAAARIVRRGGDQLHVTGCGDANAYFRVALAGATPGIARVVSFAITLPGGAQQDTRSGASVRILAVSDTQISGSFETLVRPADGTTIVRAHGTFDVPRLPDA
jgi:hypothetical protein